MNDTPWEDSLLERKLQSALKDLLKTIVAFSNSVSPGHTAVIIIGQRDDGTVQGVDNPDAIQKTVRETFEKVYPPTLWRSKVLEIDGKPCVRVEIEYDGDTPHFGGPAWVRRGSSTIVATDDLFQKLIELRLSKVRELGKWIGKPITVVGDLGTPTKIFSEDSSMEIHPRWNHEEAVLTSANTFWATFKVGQSERSEPLSKLTLSWDDANKRLLVLVGL